MLAVIDDSVVNISLNYDSRASCKKRKKEKEVWNAVAILENLRSK